jgi:hypothetical protein
LPRSNKSVFINCPFDDGYRPVFDAIVFAVCVLGFRARCSREADDSGEVRLAKIERLIQECQFGIHDISAVELDPVHLLPRFNMPLELGMFFGCKRFGSGAQKRKISLILDREPYRYQKFISDIAGHDIRAHYCEPQRAIIAVRDWIATQTGQPAPGGGRIAERYDQFRLNLPNLCRKMALDPDSLTFIDLSNVILDWLKSSR